MPYYRVEYTDNGVTRSFTVEAEDIQSLVSNYNECKLIKIEEVEVLEPIEMLKELLPILPVSFKQKVEMTIDTYGDKQYDECSSLSRQDRAGQGQETCQAGQET